MTTLRPASVLILIYDIYFLYFLPDSMSGNWLRYNTIKGDMVAVVGEVWRMTEPLTTIQWNAPRPVAPKYVEEVRYKQ